mmetsp:Transcript_8705/g.21098  ORF Transcript_8705/g.21098 Transcript_8705/m.21098 type:complete len:91 (+) Transcript_8705:70-342(+)|eukprot:CAMPEP_0179009032 /NCGR_PEP_ID=MMETSP0795-20121207/16054_1 /TAXON_ID=88552 /ORGANISM="Amoebophrya sp., Strain Ameob2" /LENGTH=90 /DNA_ID=CAMNT_0020704199 /DNA_START=67 /DNA_END=339 /DNA_ORIENTATION=-
MSRRGNANFARQAQQPVIKDAVYRECAYKEWVTHQFNKVEVTAWGDQKPEPKVTAQMQHFAPPKAYGDAITGARPAGKPSAVPDDLQGKM